MSERLRLPTERDRCQAVITFVHKPLQCQHRKGHAGLHSCRWVNPGDGTHWVEWNDQLAKVKR